MIKIEGSSFKETRNADEIQIQDIPPEIIAMTLNHLLLADIGRACLVQKQWNALKNDALQTQATFWGHEKGEINREVYLRELFLELKDLCNKGMIPEHLIIYHDEEKTKIAYEKTLANCCHLSKSEIVDLMHKEAYFYNGAEEKNCYPRFTHYLLKNVQFNNSENFLDRMPGFFTIQDCVLYGSIEGVELLLKCGIDPNFFNGCPLLVAAIFKSHDDIACLLLSCKVDVNASNHAGFTALHMAAFHGNTRLIKLLLDSGAVATIGGPGKIGDEPFCGGGETGLMPSAIASLKGHTDAAKLLEGLEKEA